MDIVTNKDKGILRIEFNRPEKKNSITSAMYQALADAIAEGEADAGIRVLMICGKPEIFTAGNDLDDFLNVKEDLEDRPVAQFMRNLSGATKPVLAAVAGAAIGIGTTLLLHCDLIFAGESAKFSMPFAKLGLCPEFASSLILPGIIGYQRAAELLFLGESISAVEARDLGLVNRVVPDEDLMPFALSQAAKLALLPPSSLRTTKRLMKRHAQNTLIAQMTEENKFFGAMLQEPAAKEAFAAFFERRAPDYSKLV